MMKWRKTHRLMVGLLTLLSVVLCISGFTLLLDGRDAYRNLLIGGLIGGVAFLSAISLVRKSWSDYYLWVMILLCFTTLLVTVFLLI